MYFLHSWKKSRKSIFSQQKIIFLTLSHHSKSMGCCIWSKMGALKFHFNGMLQFWDTMQLRCVLYLNDGLISQFELLLTLRSRCSYQTPYLDSVNELKITSQKPKLNVAKWTICLDPCKYFKSLSGIPSPKAQLKYTENLQTIIVIRSTLPPLLLAKIF